MVTVQHHTYSKNRQDCSIIKTISSTNMSDKSVLAQSPPHLRPAQRSLVQTPPVAAFGLILV